jgi:hypothetical protein
VTKRAFLNRTTETKRIARITGLVNADKRPRSKPTFPKIGNPMSIDNPRLFFLEKNDPTEIEDRATKRK